MIGERALEKDQGRLATLPPRMPGEALLRSKIEDVAITMARTSRLWMQWLDRVDPLS
jgi:hypothetical protein